MAISRRYRRRQQQAFRHHRMRLEALEKRYALNAAPVLDPAASPQLKPFIEGSGVPIGRTGTLVSDLIGAGPVVSNFDDADGDLPGIAITGTNLQGGALWCSFDDGTSWFDVGAVSDDAPRLFAADATTRVYFEPAAGFSGTISDVISFKAWDRNVIWQQLGAEIDGEAAANYSRASVSISADGQTIAIGATGNDGNGMNSGSVRIYRWTGSAWSQLGADIYGEAAHDMSGGSVSISDDGETVAIGARYNGYGTLGHVRIYRWTGLAWSQLGADIDGEATNDYSGESVSISADGETVAIGAKYNKGNGNNSGHVRIYRWTGLAWSQLGADIDGEATNDYSGESVSISADGETVAIGAEYNDGNGNNSGHVRIYRWTGLAWSQLGADIDGEAADDRSGGAISISADGETVAIGATGNGGNGINSGHVRIYRWTGLAWSQLGADIDGEAFTDHSGESVSISADGETVAIGALGSDGLFSISGQIRIFSWDGSAWVQDDGISAGWGTVSMAANGQIIARGPVPSQSHRDVRLFQIVPAENSLSSLADTISITANTLNEAAPFLAPLDVTTNEDTAKRITLNATDADSSTLTYTVTSNPSHGTISIDGNHATYVPAANFFGVDTFVVMVSDNHPVYPKATTALVTVTVNAVNDMPTLDELSDVIIPEDAFEQVILLGGVSAGQGEGQPLRVTATSNNTGLIPDPTVTYPSPNAAGNIAFTPAANEHGTATITVTVEDGGVDHDLATVEDNGAVTQAFTVSVYSVMERPVLDSSASPQLAPVIEDSGVPVGAIGTRISDIVQVGGVLNNFSDDDGGPAGIAITEVNPNGLLWYSTDNGARWDLVGSVTDESPHLLGATSTARIYYEPDDNFSGSLVDAITFRAWDGTTPVWYRHRADIDGEAADDRSGGAVSISADGQTIAIGATGNDGNGINSGHVRIYRWTGSAWSQLGADIDGEAADDRSGRAVSISADGETVAIGASSNDGNGYNSGHVRIYRWSGSAWSQLGADIDGEAVYDYSGGSVSISADGETVAIGATSNDGNGYNSGHVRIYRWSGSAWSQLGADIDGDGEAVYDYSGGSVSISADGETVAIGATGNNGNGTDSGHVRIYRWTGSAWSQLGADIDGEAADDRSGGAVSISADGETVAIGAVDNDGNGYNSGHVRIYRWTGSAWSQLGADIDGEAADDRSGGAVSISADGETVAIGAVDNDGNGYKSGHVRIYRWTGSAWSQLGADIDGEAADDYSGGSVSISADGETVAIGATGNNGNGTDSGHVRFYHLSSPISLATDTAGINVLPVNDWPSLADKTVGTVENIAVGVILDAIDVDSEELAYAVTGTPANGSVDIINGVATYTPAENFVGTDTFTVTVSDNHPTAPATDTATVTITVAKASNQPTLTALSDLVILEDSAEQIVSLEGISAGSSETQPLRISATSSDTSLVPNPTISYLSPNAIGSLRFTPVADAFGTATITVTVEHGGSDNDLATTADNLTLSQSFDVEVEPVNDMPSVTSDAPALIYEDSPVLINLTAVDIDSDSESLSYTIKSGPNSGIAEIVGTQVTYSPEPNVFGVQVSFVVSVNDNHPTDPRTTATTVSFFILNENDPPSLGVVSDITILEDAPEQTVSLTGILAGPFEQQQPLRVIARSSLPSLIPDPTVTYASEGNANGLSFTPVSDAHGTATITVSLEDAGNDNDLATTGDNLTYNQTFDVVVTPVNDAPILGEIMNLVVEENSPGQLLQIQGISAGADEDQMLRLAVTSSHKQLISNAFISMLPELGEESRLVGFAPNPDQYGVATITVTVEDAGLDGELDTPEDNATFSRTFDITVTPDAEEPPAQPRLVNQLFIHETLSTDTPVSYRIPAVNINGEPVNGLKTRITGMSGNTAIIPDATTIYGATDVATALSLTPAVGGQGKVTFTINVEDGGPDNNLATVEDNRTASHLAEVTVLEIIADSGSSILSQDPESNVYADTQPITLDERQAQTDINGFAAVGAESTSAGNAVLVQREGTTYRLVAENTWQIIGMFDSLRNASVPVLSPVARQPVEFALTTIPGAYVIDSLTNPTLTVHRGQKVTFDLNVTGHPFYLQTTGGGYVEANVYSKGFTGNNETTGRFEWVVPEDAPDELFYQCEFHPVMFGKIIVLD